MRGFLIFAFALCLAIAPAARAGSITLVVSDNGGPYLEFSNALESALQGSNWKITASGKPEAIDSLGDRRDLVVTAGSDALRQMLLRGGTTPIIATLLPRQIYEKILAESGKGRGRITAIYLDQPPARQAAFLHHLLPTSKRIGMLLSQETRALDGFNRQALNNAGLSLETEDCDTSIALLPALNALLPRVNVLLANPDSQIYKRDNIKTILVTAYRSQRPVVGFSAAFVNAGALAAIYSTPAQIAHQTADVIVVNGTTLPAPMAPKLFAITINQSVAQALDLNLPDEAVIRRALLAERGAQ